MSTSRFLSEEWLDLLQTQLAHAKPDADLAFSAVVEFVTTKRPDGDVRWAGVFEDGVLVSVAIGAATNPDLSLTTVYPDSVAILRGELDLNTAFMQGRMKVTGPTGPLLALIAQSQTPAHRAALNQVLAETSF